MVNRLISRRDFIKKCAYCACGMTAWGAFPSLGLRSAFASGNNKKVLFVNLNGGWDTLQVLQPATGQLYNTLANYRPTLKTDPSQLLMLSSDYGLHPNLTNINSIWQEGKLGAIFNLGYENMSRSHQDAEVAFARGVIDRKNPTASGFINRLGEYYKFTSMQAVSVSGTDPAFSGGAFTGVQTPGLENYYYEHFGSDWSEGYFRQDNLYSQASLSSYDILKPKQKETLNAVDLAINTSTTIKSAVKNATFIQNYPNTYLGRSFKDSDILFSTPTLNTEISYIRRIGFDTHSNQGSSFPNLLAELDTAFGIFVTNMKAKGLWNNLMIVIFSEFGRTNKENASAGTDHGGASTVLVSGGLTNGGLYGELQLSDLTDNGWLPQRYYTVELYRQVIAKMGYDPQPIFGNTAGPSLGGLFI